MKGMHDCEGMAELGGRNVLKEKMQALSSSLADYACEDGSCRNQGDVGFILSARGALQCKIGKVL